MASSASRSGGTTWSRARVQPVCGDKPEIDWDSAWQNVKKSIPSVVTNINCYRAFASPALLQVWGRLQCSAVH